MNALRRGAEAAVAAVAAWTNLMSDSDESDEEAPPTRQGKGPREHVERTPTVRTNWWLMIDSEEVRDPMSLVGRRFRRRYRVSFVRFQDLVADASTWLKPNNSPVFARPFSVADTRPVPVAIKVMLALRYLASSASFEMLGELSQTSESLARVAAMTWCREFSKRRGVDWCSPPTGDALKEQMYIFARCGFPGAIFSCDVVHLAWDKCPAGLASIHRGKEGYPTRAFEVSVTHDKGIIAATTGHPGARNDKTIVRYDDFILDIKEKRLWSDVVFKLHRRVAPLAVKTYYAPFGLIIYGT